MSFISKLFGKKEEQQVSQNEVSSPQTEQAERNNDDGVKIRVLPRIKVDYSHPIYKSDSGKKFLGNDLPDDIKLPEDQLPIVKKLFDDVILCFAIDKGSHYELLKKELFLTNPQINEDILHQVSINALINEIGNNIKLNGDPEDVVMVTAGGNFEAAIILIDDFWDQIHQVFGEKIIISIPARDLLFICKENNAEGKQKMKEMIRNFFESPDTQGILSKALYSKNAGKTEFTLLESAF